MFGGHFQPAHDALTELNEVFQRDRPRVSRSNHMYDTSTKNLPHQALFERGKVPDEITTTIPTKKATFQRKNIANVPSLQKIRDLVNIVSVRLFLGSMWPNLRDNDQLLRQKRRVKMRKIWIIFVIQTGTVRRKGMYQRRRKPVGIRHGTLIHQCLTSGPFLTTPRVEATPRYWPFLSSAMDIQITRYSS
jgi:hypothetical protein